MNNIREEALKFDKNWEEIKKMCRGGEIAYNGVDFSGGLYLEYQKWCKQNYNEIQKIRDQVWQQ